MALPKGKSLDAMRKMREDKTEEDEDAVLNTEEKGEENNNEELYGAKLETLLKEIDENFELETEAQELVLKMTDEFVKKVTKRAAEYAKHRKSATLQAVDLQLCLEKHWGISVPGLAVRPRSTTGWIYRRPNLIVDEKNTHTKKATSTTSKKRKAVQTAAERGGGAAINSLVSPVVIDPTIQQQQQQQQIKQRMLPPPTPGVYLAPVSHHQQQQALVMQQQQRAPPSN
uniref:Transcription initiation factor TFIID subunit 12 domain-containing protein n=1 Tax=Aureoumbra lagunensis TaxID=44058 RepID=A0A7S3JUA8_9STRA